MFSSEIEGSSLSRRKDFHPLGSVNSLKGVWQRKERSV